jgi:hypothetical protein
MFIHFILIILETIIIVKLNLILFILLVHHLKHYIFKFEFLNLTI